MPIRIKITNTNTILAGARYSGDSRLRASREPTAYAAAVVSSHNKIKY